AAAPATEPGSGNAPPGSYPPGPAPRRVRRRDTGAAPPSTTATPGDGHARSCRLLAGAGGQAGQFAQVGPGIEPAIVAIGKVKLQTTDARDLKPVDRNLSIDQRQRANLPVPDAGCTGAGLAQRQTTEGAELAVRPA